MWCEVVWCGVVWCGVVWCGGVVWYDTCSLLHYDRYSPKQSTVFTICLISCVLFDIIRYLNDSEHDSLPLFPTLNNESRLFLYR